MNIIMLHVFNIPVDFVAEAVPLAVFPPYKTFPGLIFVIKSIFKKKEPKPEEKAEEPEKKQE